MKPKLILIGSSTGGPGHLEKILRAIPADFKHIIIIAQHMDEVFIPSMVKRFSERTTIPVLLAQKNEPIQNKSIIFTYGKLTRLIHKNNLLYLEDSTQERPYLPSVECLYHATTELCKEYNVLACLLTGIGNDGAKAMLELFNAGAKCVAEDESSCIVYGMPKSAFELNKRLELLPLNDIINKIINF